MGEFELNRNPENYFLDVEQAAFTPTNIVPGLDYSPDKMHKDVYSHMEMPNVIV